MAEQKLGELIDLLTNKKQSYRTMKSLIESRLAIHDINNTCQIIEGELIKLKLAKLEMMRKLNSAVKEFDDDLKETEAVFNVGKASPYARDVVAPTINVEIGYGIPIPAQLYRSVDQVPDMTYGAVNLGGQTMIIYKYTRDAYVSCTAFMISDFSNNQTICCINGKNCAFGKTCRYYHDPAVWLDSKHTQRFQKTYMLKNCQFFGHSAYFADQVGKLTFNQLRTLGRYCSIMNLLIKVCLDVRNRRGR